MNFSDCIKDQLKNFLKVTRNDLFSRCSSVWLTNVTYGLLDDYNNLPSCNETDSTEQSLVVGDFFLRAGAYNIPECKSN